MLRSLCFVLLVVLGAAAPAGVAASFADLCCPDGSGDEATHDDCDDCDDAPGDDERGCECPLGCGACCGAFSVRAIAPASRAELEAPVAGAGAVVFGDSIDPPRGAVRDIAHVPKLAI